MRRVSGLDVTIDLVVPHLSSIATGPETPEKPVTPDAANSIWSLAFGLAASLENAQAFQRCYERARSDPDPSWAVLLAHSWQEFSANVPEDDVSVPWAHDLHHQIVDLLEHRNAPGRTVTVGAGATVTCPRTVRLPCKHCGYMFESRYRGGRFRRTCGLCFSYSPAPPQHPRGGVTGYKAGVYRHRRAGRTLGVEQYGQDVLCAHPDCLRLFVSTRGDEEYCDEHHGKREHARRLRDSLPANHTRFAFTPAPGFNRVQYSRGPRSEEVIIEADQTWTAVDGAELLTLAAFVAQGSLVVHDRLRSAR